MNIQISQKSGVSDSLASPVAAEGARCPFAAGMTPSAFAESGSARGLAPQVARLSPVPELSLSRLTQTFRFMRRPFAFIRETRKEKGDLFALDLLGIGRIVFVCSAELLHEVYKIPEDKVVAGEIRRKMISYLSGEKSSVSIDGEAYLCRRRIITPYLSGYKVNRHAETIRQQTERAIAGMPVGEVFELQPHLNHIARAITLRMFFGPLENERVRRLSEACADYLDAIGWGSVQNPLLQRSFGRWSPWARFLARRQKVYDAIQQEIETRLREAPGQHDDLLSALMDAELDEDPATAREMILHELTGLLVGGPETASKVLAWTLLGVLSDPTILTKLRQELDTVLGDTPIEAEHLRQLPYLDAVVNEGMRFQPIAPFAGPRLTMKPIELGGHSIEPGTVLAQGVSEVGRSACFHNHDQFDPNNFFGQDVRLRDWVPFGGGLRRCPGMGSGLLTVAMALATLVRHVDFELQEGPTEPARHGIGFQPKNGLAVRLVDKRGL